MTRNECNFVANWSKRNWQSLIERSWRRALCGILLREQITEAHTSWSTTTRRGCQSSLVVTISCPKLKGSRTLSTSRLTKFQCRCLEERVASARNYSLWEIWRLWLISRKSCTLANILISSQRKLSVKSRSQLRFLPWTCKLLLQIT